MSYFNITAVNGITKSVLGPYTDLEAATDVAKEELQRTPNAQCSIVRLLRVVTAEKTVEVVTEQTDISPDC